MRNATDAARRQVSAMSDPPAVRASAVTIAELGYGDSSAEVHPFGLTAEGEAVQRVILSHPDGLEVAVLTYGATLQAIVPPGRDGAGRSVILGFASIDGYIVLGERLPRSDRRSVRQPNFARLARRRWHDTPALAKRGRAPSPRRARRFRQEGVGDPKVRLRRRAEPRPRVSERRRGGRVSGRR